MDDNNTAINRKMADFPPSVWGDYFCKYAYDDSTNDHDIPDEKISELKEEVRRMITFDVDNPSQTLDLIDQVQRLGISYLFESEIENTLEHIHKLYFEVSNGDINGDLYMTALLFRLLRQQGYKISCNIFDKFKDKNGSFIDSLANDVQGLLSLYEASHMRIHGEETLEYALAFCLTHLKISPKNKVVVTPLLKAQVMHAINQPIRKGLQRVAARQYFSIYQQDPFYIDNLLTLAKLDFNSLQKQHQKELSEMSRWWKELDLKKKLPFGRDRLVECYFWTSGVFFEPQYALGRKLMCKISVMITAIDDAYDVYGTIDELEHFTKAVQRWERDVQDKLSNCMQVLYEAMLDLYDEIGSLLAEQGKLCYLHYAKEGMKTLIRAYFQEITWLHQNRIPSMEEYMSTALVTSGYGLGAIIAFIGMGDIIKEDVLKWASTNPKIIKASAVILRLSDDIASRKIERKREHIPSAVECYMNEHEVTEKDAEEELLGLISRAWKDINEESLHPIFHRTILMRVINLARVANYMYSGGEDQFTVNALQLKDMMTSLYVDAVQI